MVIALFYCIIGLQSLFRPCNGDALNPRRPPTEEDFFKMGHHERSMTEKEMYDKLAVVKKRRDWTPWDINNTRIHDKIEDIVEKRKSGKERRPNILLMVSDDLGYGDLSVHPFVRIPDKKFPCGEGGVLSPQLERMAAQGAIMTNFHSASPVCSPSRVAIMTGLYPWRMNAMNAFELGRDLSQRNGFLPQVPTGPEVLREAGYYTAHSGKWHLGGMREEMRIDRVQRDQCSVGSPNQHGFEEYVSELDGPESPRYTFLNRNSILHSQGHRHLLRDDIPVPIINAPDGQPNILSDREVRDAITVIQESQRNRPDQPWFVQVWFNAPHGPWEVLKRGEEPYSKTHQKDPQYWENYQCNNPPDRLYNDRNWQYKTMVSAMDQSIGMMLDALEEMKLSQDTLVIFTSDNGPEVGAGTAGIYREGKRSLMEGGIRVPAIFQWIGTIAPGTVIPTWGATTDLFPTFLDVARVEKPKDVLIDGISLLPLLLYPKLIDAESTNAHHHHKHHKDGNRRLLAHNKMVNIHHANNNSNNKIDKNIHHRFLSENENSFDYLSSYRHIVHQQQPQPPQQQEQQQQQQQQAVNDTLSAAEGSITSTTSSSIAISSNNNDLTATGIGHIPNVIFDRLFLWHKDTDKFKDNNDERIQSAAYYKELKFITWTPKGCLDKIFDMKHDPLEAHNLLAKGNSGASCHLHFDKFDGNKFKEAINPNAAKGHCEAAHTTSAAQETCKSKYVESIVQKMEYMFPRLKAFVQHGKKVHDDYMQHRLHQATCKVPSISEIKPIHYELSPDCEARWECSIPEH